MARDKQVAQIERLLISHKCEPLRRTTHGIIWKMPGGGTYLLSGSLTRARDYLNVRAALKRHGIEIP